MGKETIKAVTEFERRDDDRWNTEAGFDIETTEQTITLAIDNDANCCESWGYFLTEDDTEKFIGAELLGVEITDTNRSNRTFKEWDWRKEEPENNEDLNAGDVMFVDIRTNRGILQFVAYNAHNGYYGHEARVSSKQLTHSEVL